MNRRSETADGSNPLGSQWGPRNSAGVAIASSIRFENIQYAYGQNPVLKDVSLNVEPGEILCLLGPSGSGKTTLLRIAAGLESPQSGSVFIDGQPVDNGKTFVGPEKRGAGLVFQDFALFPHMTVLQNVKFGLNALSAREATQHAKRLLQRVGMAEYADVYPHKISGGEQQRVALARALAPRPRILLMDEPFSGLDARLRDHIRGEAVELLRDTRSTTIIVTHDPEEALRLGDHIALMREGRIEQYGTGHALYHQPKSLFAAEFFTELNVLDGICDNGVISTPLGNVSAPKVASGTKVKVAVRLSDIDFSPVADAVAVLAEATNTENGIEVIGQIRSRRFMGVVELLELSLAGEAEPVRLRIKAGRLGGSVKHVKISVSQDKFMVFSD